MFGGSCKGDSGGPIVIEELNEAFAGRYVQVSLIKCMRHMYAYNLSKVFHPSARWELSTAASDSAATATFQTYLPA